MTSVFAQTHLTVDFSTTLCSIHKGQLHTACHCWSCYLGSWMWVSPWHRLHFFFSHGWGKCFEKTQNTLLWTCSTQWCSGPWWRGYKSCPFKATHSASRETKKISGYTYLYTLHYTIPLALPVSKLAKVREDILGQDNFKSFVELQTNGSFLG